MSKLPDQMAALQPKKVQIFDLMVPGIGTPWEDRGKIGYLAAFFQTAFGMMFSPVKTLYRIRRPETTGDATVFAGVCSALWAIGFGIHSAFDYYVFYNRDNTLDISGQQYVINSAIQAVLVGGGVFVLMKLAAIFFAKMTNYDSASKAPMVLVQNVMAYCMGPSIFAVLGVGVKYIPFGPILAGLWIILLWLASGMGRLKIRTGGAVIATIITGVGILAIAAAAAAAIGLIWVYVMGYGAIDLRPPPRVFQ